MTLEVDIQKSQRNWRATISSKLADIVAALPSALLTTRGDLITRDGSAPKRLAIGAADTFLHSDGTDPGWSVPILSKFTNALGADVNLSNTSNYFDGPSVTQGSTGIFLAWGTLTFQDATTTAAFPAKLWDGTTIAASGEVTASTGAVLSLTLAGIFTNPAGNIKLSGKDLNSTSGKLKFNASGSSKDCNLSVVRIG